MNTDVARRLRLKIKREMLYRKASKRLKPFISLTMEDYIWNWHHKLICERLNLFARGLTKNLMVFTPPQHGKSELVSRRYPAFQLGMTPDKKIAGCSYSADLARSMNRAVQRIIDDDIYREIFPETTLSGKRTTNHGSWSRTIDQFEIVGRRGGYKSVGVMGPLTGNKVDIGIIDDPIKDYKEANSQRHRDNVWNWYINVFLTRLHNDSQKLLTMTRWHEDDLAGRILELERDDWEVLILPALCEEIRSYDPREIGDALWPEMHSRGRIEGIREKTPSTFNSLYQQSPTAEDGNIIRPADWFKVTKDDYGALVTDFTVDTSYTEDKENDPTAIMAFSKFSNRLVIKNCMSERHEFHDLCRFIVNFCKSNGYTNASSIGIEPKASGKSIVQELQRTTSLNVFELSRPNESKITLAKTYAPFMQSGRIECLDGLYIKKFFEELKAFPNAKHDDMVDVLLMAIEMFHDNVEDIWAGYDYD